MILYGKAPVKTAARTRIDPETVDFLAERLVEVFLVGHIRRIDDQLEQGNIDVIGAGCDLCPSLDEIEELEQFVGMLLEVPDPALAIETFTEFYRYPVE
ncbi:MAG: hypothetical protein AB1664_05920 [Thermodesulfobacteriota bacterium]